MFFRLCLLVALLAVALCGDACGKECDYPSNTKCYQDHDCKNGANGGTLLTDCCWCTRTKTDDGETKDTCEDHKTHNSKTCEFIQAFGYEELVKGVEEFDVPQEKGS
eukprot:TRINITY_DN9750_c2_g1_i1.p1 TRINITY_DN9750_c2_g1~~TRINITY_DN9750_c2_g1_i1.p1  ORF type:complete len:107 (-),score=26.71 TRINITY_DN9750_c2_g1_i1:337-657(-)